MNFCKKIKFSWGATEHKCFEIQQILSEIRGCTNQKRHDATDLLSKTDQLKQIIVELINEQEQLLACNDDVNLLKQRNLDLYSDMENCQIKEAELLLYISATMETKVQQ